MLRDKESAESLLLHSPISCQSARFGAKSQNACYIAVVQRIAECSSQQSIFSADVILHILQAKEVLRYWPGLRSI